MEEVHKFIHDPVTEGFGPSFMAEKLAQQKGIQISKESMRQIMIAAGLHHPKPRKKALFTSQGRDAVAAGNWYR